MIEVIFKDILGHFGIEEEFPDYLYDQTFNKVFLEGEFSKDNNSYKIAVTTRQNVTHQMFLNPGEDYPVIIMSVLPNGSLNGMKFGQTSDDVLYVNEL